MRALLVTSVLVVAFLLTGCSHHRQRFLLTVTFLPSTPTVSSHLAVELRNVSGRAERVITLTNLFQGSVYLRDATGEVHQFTQTNYWNMMMTGFWITPTLELADGGSHRFEHSLSEFIRDPGHETRLPNETKWSVSFPTLATEFLPGCEIWCTFDILQWKQLNSRHLITERKETLVSPVLRHPRR